MNRVVPMLIVSLIVAGCSRESPPPPAQHPKPVALDFSTPTAALKSFAAACKAKNKDDVAKCLSQDGMIPAEFEEVRTKKLSAGKWEALFDKYAGLVVTAEHIGITAGGMPYPNIATVDVTLKGTESKIGVMKEGNVWKIGDGPPGNG